MIRRTAALVATGAAILAPPASAQDHSMHGMPGMEMPAAKPAAQDPGAEKASPRPTPQKPAARTAPANTPATAVGHEGHDMQGMDHAAMPEATDPQKPTTEKDTPAQARSVDHDSPSEMDHGGMEAAPQETEHAGHDMSASGAMQAVGTALPAGNAPAPQPPSDHYADRQFSPEEMTRARRQMMREEGGQTFSQVMFNLAEVQVREGRNVYAWEGEAWFGGDINRVTLKTEGEGALRGGLEAAEVQALYSRAIGPYFNFQAGIRYDIKPNPSRTYAVIGFEGLAPYWFEVEGAVFLSDKGDLLGRFGGYYDQRLTQRLVLQPRVEFNFAAQDVPENRIGAGLSDAQLGVRLRYEITRQFAPYVGISYEAKTGQTARYARADGDDPTSTSFVAGIRIWF